jgi:hypothetical protein
VCLLQKALGCIAARADLRWTVSKMKNYSDGPEEVTRLCGNHGTMRLRQSIGQRTSRLPPRHS